jgi:hypothetical protein
MEEHTEFDSLVGSVSRQFETVLSAPVPFLILISLVGLFIWRYLHHHFNGRMSDKDSLLQLRDAQIQDYKEKLSGATPDEAKARIEALEVRLNQTASRIEALGPRRISPDQIDLMVQVLEQRRGSSVSIVSDGISGEAAQISKGLVAAFRSAAWKVTTPMVLGLGNPPVSGIALRVVNPDRLTEQEECVAKAFTAALLDYDVQAAGARLPIECIGDPVEVVLTTKLQD